MIAKLTRRFANCWSFYSVVKFLDQLLVILWSLVLWRSIARKGHLGWCRCLCFGTWAVKIYWMRTFWLGVWCSARVHLPIIWSWLRKYRYLLGYRCMPMIVVLDWMECVPTSSGPKLILLSPPIGFNVNLIWFHMEVDENSLSSFWIVWMFGTN